MLKKLKFNYMNNTKTLSVFLSLAAILFTITTCILAKDNSNKSEIINKLNMKLDSCEEENIIYYNIINELWITDSNVVINAAKKINNDNRY